MLRSLSPRRLRTLSEESARRKIMARLARGGLLDDWTGTWTSPAERVILSKYKHELTRRVLEFGTGGGRMTGHLIQIGNTLVGVDIAADMVNHCREHHPTGTFVQEDLRNLSAWDPNAWDAIYSAHNNFDTFTYNERAALLASVRRLLRPGGLFIFSSHNRGALPPGTGSWPLVRLRPRRSPRWLARHPRAVLNYLRIAMFQHIEDDYAIVVDEALDYSLLQIYIARDAQQRQLSEHGLVLLDCFAEDGAPVDAGAPASQSTSLIYVARSTAEA
jgi:SAM-dependent methyltransferase